MAKNNFTLTSIITGATPAAGFGNTIISAPITPGNLAASTIFPEYFTSVNDLGPRGNGQFALPSIFVDAGTTAANTTIGANALNNNGNLPARVVMVAAGGAGGAGLSSRDTNSAMSPGSGGGAGGVIIFNRLYIAPNSTFTSTTSVGATGNTGALLAGDMRNGSTSVGAPTTQRATNLIVTIGSTTYRILCGGPGSAGQYLPNDHGWLGSSGASAGGTAYVVSKLSAQAVPNSGPGLNNTSGASGFAIAGTFVGDYPNQGQLSGTITSSTRTPTADGIALGGAGFRSQSASFNDNWLTALPKAGSGIGWLQQTANSTRTGWTNDLFLISAGGGGGRIKAQGTTGYTTQLAVDSGGDIFTANNESILTCIGGNGGGGATNGVETPGLNGYGRVDANQSRPANAAQLSQVLGIDINNIYTGGHGGGGGGWSSVNDYLTTRAKTSGGGANGFITIHFRSTARVNLPGSQGNGNVVIFGSSSPANANVSNVGALQVQGGGVISGNIFARGNLINSNLSPFLTSSTTVNAFPEVGEVFATRAATISGNLQLSVGGIYRVDNTTTPGIRTFTVGPYGSPTYTLVFSGATNQANLKYLGGRDLAASPVASPCYWQRIS